MRFSYYYCELLEKGMTTVNTANMDKKEVVEHILRYKKNYYTLLGVAKTATSDEVSAAYKKMALKCHPDKNDHPQAAEAFKILGSARDVLTDPKLRQSYVRRGDEGVRQYESGAQARARGAHRHPVDPFEDLFTFFSSGGFFQQEGVQGANGRRYYAAGRGPPPDARPRAAPQGNNQNNNNNNANTFFMFLPLLMFIIMVMLLQSGWETVNPASYAAQQGPLRGKGGERLFSLTPNPDLGMVVRRKTSLYNVEVEYYVSHKYIHQLQKKETLMRLEHEVLREKEGSLRRRCQADKFNNRGQGNNDEPSSCQEYSRISRALG